MDIHCFEKAFKKIFLSYGRFVARHPSPFIILPMVVTIGVAAGVMFMTRQTDISYLYTTENSKIRDSQTGMLSHWPDTPLLAENFVRVHIIPKFPEGDQNLWKREIMEEVVQLDRVIRDITITDQDTDSTYRWEDVCALSRWTGACQTTGMLDLIQYNSSNMDKLQLKYPFHPITVVENFEPFDVFTGLIIGGVTVKEDWEDERYKEVVSFESTYLMYKTNGSDSYVWERGVRKFLLQKYANISENRLAYISLTLFDAEAFEDEIQEVSTLVLPYIGVTFGILLTFAVLVSCSLDWVISKPWLAVCGILSALMAVGCGFGLLLFFLPYTDMAGVVPFLGLGIGLDDMFVMMSSWRQTNKRLKLEERVAETMADAAVSITITTLTDVLALGTGIITDIPSVRFFCIFAVVVICLDYIFQITFFAGCMVFDGLRESRGLHALVCVKPTPKEDAAERSALFRFWCIGGEKPGGPDGPSEVFPMRFFRDKFAVFITKPKNKLMIIVLYAGYIGGAIYGSLHIGQGLEFNRVISDYSFLNADITSWDKYHRVYDNEIFVVIKEPLNYWNASERGRIDRMLAKFEETSYFHDANVTHAWTRDFDRFTSALSLNVTKDNFLTVFARFISLPAIQNATDQLQLWTGITPGLNFFADIAGFIKFFLPGITILDKQTIAEIQQVLEQAEQLGDFRLSELSKTWAEEYLRFTRLLNVTITQKTFSSVLEQFLKLPRYSMYQDHVVVNASGHVTASRFLVYPKNQLTKEIKMDTIRQAWEIQANSEIKFDFNNEVFISYESWLVVLPLLLQNVGIATGCVLFVCLLFIPNPICSFYVALSIVSICLGLMGYMSFWGVNVDTASIICIIMAVGFSVDFSAHITYAFTVAKGKDKNVRVQQALYSLGWPIFQATSSTILALLVLVNSFAYIFRVFFITNFLTMVIGGLHGLVFLPVVLSIMGPGSPDDDDESESDNSRSWLTYYGNNFNKHNARYSPKALPDPSLPEKKSSMSDLRNVAGETDLKKSNSLPSVLDLLKDDNYGGMKDYRYYVPRDENFYFGNNYDKCFNVEKEFYLNHLNSAVPNVYSSGPNEFPEIIPTPKPLMKKIPRKSLYSLRHKLTSNQQPGLPRMTFALRSNTLPYRFQMNDYEAEEGPQEYEDRARTEPFGTLSRADWLRHSEPYYVSRDDGSKSEGYRTRRFIPRQSKPSSRSVIAGTLARGEWARHSAPFETRSELNPATNVENNVNVSPRNRLYTPNNAKQTGVNSSPNNGTLSRIDWARHSAPYQLHMVRNPRGDAEETKNRNEETEIKTKVEEPARTRLYTPLNAKPSVNNAVINGTLSRGDWARHSAPYELTVVHNSQEDAGKLTKKSGFDSRRYYTLKRNRKGVKNVNW